MEADLQKGLASKTKRVKGVRVIGIRVLGLGFYGLGLRASSVTFTRCFRQKF